jgi:hypothetical protein
MFKKSSELGMEFEFDDSELSSLFSCFGVKPNLC